MTNRPAIKQAFIDFLIECNNATDTSADTINVKQVAKYGPGVTATARNLGTLARDGWVEQRADGAWAWSVSRSYLLYCLDSSCDAGASAAERRAGL